LDNSGLLLEIKKLKAAIKVRGWVQVMLPLSLVAPRAPLAAEVGGKPEKVDIIVTYAQPSGAFTPIWVAHEAGLFKKTIGEYAKIEDARTSTVLTTPLRRTGR
jgi:hypothetical protein